MRLPRFRTHRDRALADYAEIVCHEWAKVPSHVKAQWMVDRPELYFTVAAIAAHHAVSTRPQRWHE